MQKTALLAVASVSMALSCQGVCVAAAEEQRPSVDSGPALPTYSREEVAQACLNEYGMANSSLIDCLAQDEKDKASLSRRWADIRAAVRKDCVKRLADRRVNSYFHLNGCIRSPRLDAAAPD